MPGIEGGRGNVAAVAAGVSSADGDATGGDVGRWGEGTRSDRWGEAPLA